MNRTLGERVFVGACAASMLACAGCQLSRSVLGASIDHDAATDPGDAAVTPEDAWSTDDAWSMDDAFVELPDAGHETCGDGHLASTEDCDDHNAIDGDGCSASCHIDMGYRCTGEPSACVTMCGDGVRAGTEACDGEPGCTACVPDGTQIVVRGGGLALAIADDAYDGSLGSMTCVDLPVTQFPLDHVALVAVDVAMSHTWIGDLTIKLASPSGTVVTLMSRPGRGEGTDDGSGAMGDGSALIAANGITFVTEARVSSEDMGNTLTGGVVCRDDSICAFAPSHDAAPAGDLTTFAGQTAHGTWRFCVGDGARNDTGSVDRVALTLMLN